MIRSNYLIFVAAALLLVGCQKATNTNTTTSNTAPAVANSNANSAPASSNATADDPGDLNGSPTEVYKAAYTARKNCDVAGLKKVMSKKLLDYLTEMGKMEVGKAEKKSLDDTLKDICANPQASTEQVRNEKIDGDRASIEYLDENNEWQPMDFVREDGVWKMSLAGPGSEDQPDSPINDKNDNRS